VVISDGVSFATREGAKLPEIIDLETLPLEKAVFASLIRTLGLPPSFIYMRIYAGAAGNCTVHRTRDKDGNVSIVGIVYRAPHAIMPREVGVWAMALVWNPSTNFLTGLFEGASAADVEYCRGALAQDPADTFHPLLFAQHMLTRQMMYYDSRRRDFARTLVLLEIKVGLTREKEPDEVWFWSDNQVRKGLKEINSLGNGFAYLEKQIDSVARYAEFLKDLVKAEKEAMLMEDEEKEGMAPFDLLGERLSNMGSLLNNTVHHMACLQRRLQLLISVARCSCLRLFLVPPTLC
jgi:hypothetical protein